MNATTRTETRPRVSVEHLDPADTDALYYRYSGQTRPQDCYVALDLETGRLWAGWDAQLGGGVPEREWNGVVQTWRIPALRASAANALLDELADDAQALLSAAVVEYRDGNRRGVLDDDAQDAYWRIKDRIEHCIDDPTLPVHVWDAADFFAGLGDEQQQREYLQITSETTDAELDDLARSELEDGDVDVIEGLDDYLRRLRDEAPAYEIVRYAADGHAGEPGDGDVLTIVRTLAEAREWIREQHGELERWAGMDDDIEAYHESADEGCGGWAIRLEDDS